MARDARPLVDKHGRTFRYLRVAVTERCNLRCVYCMPETGIDFKGNEQVLSIDELLRVIHVAVRAGVDKVRFTGGEPLVRKGIVRLIAETVATPGVSAVHLTTNGLLLRRVASDLRGAGLSGVNISLDTLDSDGFSTITRRAGLDEVLAALDAAVELRFSSVKVNVVAMRGFNEDELGAFARLTERRPITVRFIELMPFDAQQVWKQGRFFGAHRILEALRGEFGDLPTVDGSATESHVFRLPGHVGRVAVIPSFTRSLCGACDRIRLTAHGQIRNCLYSNREFDLRGPLRRGACDEELAEVLYSAMASKRVDGWASQKEDAIEDGSPEQAGRRTSMTQIGG